MAIYAQPDYIHSSIAFISIVMMSLKIGFILTVLTVFWLDDFPGPHGEVEAPSRIYLLSIFLPVKTLGFFSPGFLFVPGLGLTNGALTFRAFGIPLPGFLALAALKVSLIPFRFLLFGRRVKLLVLGYSRLAAIFADIGSTLRLIFRPVKLVQWLIGFTGKASTKHDMELYFGSAT